MMQETQLNGESLDIVSENVSKLKELFPEIVTEDKIDFNKLREVLGNYTEDDNERYNFTWKGKSSALRLAQTPSTGTLRPCKEESKNWDTTENLYIEGDNLEVLKLLQKSYYGKIKMIYIDPPYNTGKEFVYPDNYKDNLQNYLEMTGQLDSEGTKISTNSDTSGRYHTNWLNMMYPRLRLARNLLNDEGVIFISIDDNEVDNLRKLCNEVFGEENFVVEFAWRRNDNQSNIGNVARVKEYIVSYCKSKNSFYFDKLPLSDKAKKEYRYNDEKGFFRRQILLHKTRGRHVYDLKTPSGNILNGPWMIKKEQFIELEQNNGIYWTKGGEEQPYGKLYLTESRGQIINDFLGIEFGTNQRASLEVEKLFNKRIFDFPKPVSLIKTFLTIATNKNSIILDFFSGSGTTADAIMQLNAEDSGDRRFIMIQLPEPTPKKSPAYNAGYYNISEIGKERIKLAGDKIISELNQNGQTSLDSKSNHDLDIGIKVFKLDSSNLSKWDPEYDNLEQTLLDSVENMVPGRKELDLVYEIMLKYGIDLTLPIEEYQIRDKKLYSIGFGALIICLDDNLTSDLASEIIKLKDDLSPEVMRVVFKDNGFASDSDKTNIKETLKTNGIEAFVTI